MVCICKIECSSLVNGLPEHLNLAASSRQDMETTVDGALGWTIDDPQTLVMRWKPCLRRCQPYKSFTVDESDGLKAYN
jgi:hypothetical protein